MSSRDVPDEPQVVLLEALYYAGGLKAKLYGAAQRPTWLPAADRVGLHNDVFPGPGQWVADLSRFEYADGRVTTRSGLTWLGVYTHAVDVYGDRGNFCGVGVWLAEGVILDYERALAVLLTLADFLQSNLPKDGSPQLPPLVEVNCTEGLIYLRDKCVLGRAEQPAGLPVAGHHSADCSYVVLPLSTLDSKELAPILDLLSLADVSITTPRVLFIAGETVKFDAKVSPKKRLAGLPNLIGPEGARLQLVKHLLAVGAASQQAEQDFRKKLSTSQSDIDALKSSEASLRERLDLAEQNQQALMADLDRSKGLPPNLDAVRLQPDLEAMDMPIRPLRLTDSDVRPSSARPVEAKRGLSTNEELMLRLRNIENLLGGLQHRVTNAYQPRIEREHIAEGSAWFSHRFVLPIIAVTSLIVIALLIWAVGLRDIDERQHSSAQSEQRLEREPYTPVDVDVGAQEPSGH